MIMLFKVNKSKKIIFIIEKLSDSVIKHKIHMLYKVYLNGFVQLNYKRGEAFKHVVGKLIKKSCSAMHIILLFHDF